MSRTGMKARSLSKCQTPNLFPGTRPPEKDDGQKPEEVEQGNPQTQGGKTEETECLQPFAEGWRTPGIGEYEALNLGAFAMLTSYQG